VQERSGRQDKKKSQDVKKNWAPCHKIANLKPSHKPNGKRADLRGIPQANKQGKKQKQGKQNSGQGPLWGNRDARKKRAFKKGTGQVKERLKRRDRRLREKRKSQSPRTRGIWRALRGKGGNQSKPEERQRKPKG